MVDFRPGGTSVKLIDFDASKDWVPGASQASTVSGTDGYLSPEAYDGKFSPASDVYRVTPWNSAAACSATMLKVSRRHPRLCSMLGSKPSCTSQ